MNRTDSEKLARAMQARQRVIKPYRDKMENKYQWCIAAVRAGRGRRRSSPKTGLPPRRKSCGAPSSPPPVRWKATRWRTGRRTTRRWKSGALTSIPGARFPRIRKLERHEPARRAAERGPVRGRRGEDAFGRIFQPEHPFRRVLHFPQKGRGGGHRLFHQAALLSGQLIRNFSVRFENGRAVEVHAAQGEAALKKMIQMDEGASMLGECALVPFRSPINDSRVLFYNTLFDENAACHLALGRGSPTACAATSNIPKNSSKRWASTIR